MRTCGEISLSRLWATWKAGLIWTAGLTAIAAVIPDCMLNVCWIMYEQWAMLSIRKLMIGIFGVQMGWADKQIKPGFRVGFLAWCLRSHRSWGHRVASEPVIGNALISQYFISVIGNALVGQYFIYTVGALAFLVSAITKRHLSPLLILR